MIHLLAVTTISKSLGLPNILEYPTRWVEDKVVAEKLIKLWPNMVKLFEFWSSLCKSRQPSSKSYENTKKGIEDPLIIPKLHFFAFLAGLLQPFLKVFQGDGPMVPFLSNIIKVIFVTLLELIVKADVLEKAEPYELVRILDDEDNLLPTKRINLGFATENKLKSLLQTKKVFFLLNKLLSHDNSCSVIMFTIST